jgi:hypothetical protein
MAEPEFAAAYSDGGADFLPFIRIEYNAELARCAHFKDVPSRLTDVLLSSRAQSASASAISLQRIAISSN